MPKITPFLWFNDDAEAAMKFYISVFPNAEIIETNQGQGGGTFRLGKQEYIAFNGGPQFKFNEAVSLFVSCETQAEVDEYWEKLSAGGQTSRCGWLKDKFGLSWQIVPTVLGELLGDPDPAKAKRVLEAMLKMTKLEIKDLQAAAEST